MGFQVECRPFMRVWLVPKIGRSGVCEIVALVVDSPVQETPHTDILTG
ncbi:hypothetical protein EYZ11_007345 [Aspergillus tanneri]|uniref:Uncharacterized protein n=1 Tax=Aspergillus tanneri TaxID=1220188 RepID=A0A4S3JD63_9EURO|nr:hypothetical protein EYZ11_007345 [Aspergillus tanneri]